MTNFKAVKKGIFPQTPGMPMLILEIRKGNISGIVLPFFITGMRERYILSDFIIIPFRLALRGELKGKQFKVSKSLITNG